MQVDAFRGGAKLNLDVNHMGIEWNVKMIRRQDRRSGGKDERDFQSNA
jgi:hypothetical protein